MVVIKGENNMMMRTPCNHDNYAQGPVWKHNLGTPAELLLFYLHGPDMGSTLKFTNLQGK